MHDETNAGRPVLAVKEIKQTKAFFFLLLLRTRKLLPLMENE
jgi:hypothetical protein